MATALTKETGSGGQFEAHGVDGIDVGPVSFGSSRSKTGVQRAIWREIEGQRSLVSSLS